MGHHVLLTGATGFLGKVVLEQLLRRRAALGIDKVTVVVRAKRGVLPRERLARELLVSPCFRNLEGAWKDRVEAVAGDLGEAGAGLAPKDAVRLQREVTHVIHCAASVDFDRPLAEAAQANVTSSLNMLGLAKGMPQLLRFVSTSTAYVTPWRKGPIPEALAPLPRPAEAIWADVQAGVDEKKLLGETGHANTYTYTKCLAEHLLVQARAQVPLRIVRPSIISASWRQPMPGWIDSKAAFAGFVFTIGAGLLRVIDADPNTRLDIVPVDTVADHLVDAAFDPGPADVVDIVHAAVGLRQAAHIGQTSAAIVRYFRRHRIARRPVLKYLGRRNARFLAETLVHHALPHSLQSVAARLTGDGKKTKQSARIKKTLHTINEVFPYFTHHTFDFVCSRPIDPSFQPQAYVQAVCRGVATHLMQQDPRRVALAGGHARRRTPGLGWALGKRGDLPAKLTFAGLRAAVDNAFDEVSFDEASLVAAVQALPESIDVVVVPSVGGPLAEGLVRLLCFARPDLGLAIPAWSAEGAAPFARLRAGLRALAGGRAEAAHAVRFAPRGGPLHAAAPVADARARTWAQGPRPVAVLPVAFSCAQAWPSGLRGAGSRGAAPAIAWLLRLLRGQVRLGAVHLRAGAPLVVRAHEVADDATDAAVAELGGTLRRELVHGAVAYDHHLRAFLALHPQLGLDVGALRAAIVARGGQVLSPKLTRLGEPLLGATTERQLRRHWHHLFAADMVARWPNAVALRGHFGVDAEPPPGSLRPLDATGGEVPTALLSALATPVLDGWRAVGEAVQRLLVDGAQLPAEALLEAAGCPDEHVAASALRALVAQGVLRRTGGVGAYAYARRPHDEAVLARFLANCTLVPAPQAAATRLSVAQGGGEAEA